MEIKRPIQALLLDMDGVIYRGDDALPGAAGLFPALDAAGVKFALITNNSRLTAQAYAKKLDKMGITVAAEQVLTSAMATADWLREQSPDGAKVFVLGGPGLVETILANPGFSVSADAPDYVIVGLDTELTYDRLRTAGMGLLRGAKFVATNADASLPMAGGEIWPGAGAIIAALATTVGHGPVAILGKPERYMLDEALEQLQVAPEHTLVVGDRAETDILAGRRAGLPTALVLTGITTREQLPTLPAEMQPDYVFENLDELLAFVVETK